METEGLDRFSLPTRRGALFGAVLLSAIGIAVTGLIGKWLEEPLAAAGHTAGSWLTAVYRISLAVEPRNSSHEMPFSTVTVMGWVIALIFLALAVVIGLLVWALYRSFRALKNQANLDPKTGTLSPRGLKEAFSKSQSTLSPKEPSVMVLLDLVAFHKFNEKFGQSGGDKILTTVGRLLRGEMKSKEAVGRYGGDEFILLMRGHEPVVFGALRARQRELNPCPIFGIGTDVRVPFRAGVTTFANESFDIAFSRASEALQAAKKMAPEHSIIVEKAETYITLWTEGLSKSHQHDSQILVNPAVIKS
jgi:diguanylate cyclase (GGDEF)-like protein